VDSPLHPFPQQTPPPRNGHSRNRSRSVPLGKAFLTHLAVTENVATVLEFAKTLITKGKQPVVTLVQEVYHTEVKLTKRAMAEVEEQINRLPDPQKWCVGIIVNPKE
jgi:GTPase involved in cell partitioning and DNA repair